MIICFPYAFKKVTAAQIELAELFVFFARQHAQVVQVSDEATPKVAGVDDCIRRPMTEFGEWYFESMREFPEDEFLRLDTDVWVKRSPKDGFDGRYDIAIAKERKGTLNNGVVFVKTREFFSEALKAYRERTTTNNWNDIQVATQLVIDDGVFRVKKLDPDIYNFMPERPGVNHGHAKLVHFESQRRHPWMIDEIRALGL